MKDIVVILDNIRSVHNVGAIARTCDGFGISRVITLGITPHRRQPNDSRLPHVIQRVEFALHKTALGAEQWLSDHYDTTAEFLDTIADYPLVCLEQTPTSQPLAGYTAPEKFGLVVGNEIDGVSQTLLTAAAATVHIPMVGQKESFNVSVATAIALYDLGRS